jgi:hypothetical protein
LLGVQNGALIPVIYRQSSNGFGQNLVNFLVNFSQRITITGVDNTYTFPDGVVITAAAGRCFQESPDLIRVVYDVTQAGGKNYYVLDKVGNRISFPGAIILAHELSHAFHFAKGDISSDPEVQAETDENSFRDQVGLPERNAASHFGGFGLPDAQDLPLCDPNP